MTSQYGESQISQINSGNWRDDLVIVYLQCFAPKMSMKLVNLICHSTSSLYVEARSELHPWLEVVLEQLGQLPLAVRLFAEWFHLELMKAASGGDAFIATDLRVRWKHEYEKRNDDGILNSSVIGNRGLRATVRLALHNLKLHENYDACKQLLGLLALCPTSQVPWSLFHGYHVGTSASESMVRGTHVQTRDCDAAQFLTPTGESCRVLVNQKWLQGIVLSDEIVRGPNGKSIQVRIEDDPYLICSYRKSFHGNRLRTVPPELSELRKTQKDIVINILDVEFFGLCAISERDGRYKLQWFTSWEPALDAECFFSELNKSKGKKDKITKKKAFLASHDIDENGDILLHEGDAALAKRINFSKYVFLSPDVAIFKRMLVYCSSDSVIKDGRVIQHHTDGTISVIFGCNSGKLSTVKPDAAVKRFKAASVRVRHIEELADELQEVDGLKSVAKLLNSCGLLVIDEKNRMFGMHKLLQQAVGMELGWQTQCKRMQALLQARCGQFGDEVMYTGQFVVMREILRVVVSIVERVRSLDDGQSVAWCSGMLLRLFEVTQVVDGGHTEFGHMVAVAALGSLVADFVHAQVMRDGCRSEGRRMALGNVINDGPHIRDLIELFTSAKNHRRTLPEEKSKYSSKHASSGPSMKSLSVYHCLCSHWNHIAHESLLMHLVHEHVLQEGYTSLEGTKIQEIAAVPLIKDILDLHNIAESDLVLLVKSDGRFRVLEDSSCCKVLLQEREAVGYNCEEGAVGVMNRLTAMRWSAKIFFEPRSSQSIIDEIDEMLDGVKDFVTTWELNVALGHACRFAANSSQHSRISLLNRALCVMLETLGQQHPETAWCLSDMATAWAQMGFTDAAIVLYERAVHIFKRTLGQHPVTAHTMSSLGAAYGDIQQPKNAIVLQEQALSIYELTVGKIHRDAADTIYAMSISYIKMVGATQDVHNLDKAEKLALEALEIYTNTLGVNCSDAMKASEILETIRGSRVAYDILKSQP